MKKTLLICACFLLIGGLVATFVLIPKNDVESFRLSDYQKFIDACARDDFLMIDPITDKENLKNQAETLWTSLYDKDRVTSWKPFEVFFDQENSAWLVQGTVPPDRFGEIVHMIVLSDGKVIAFWSDR